MAFDARSEKNLSEVAPILAARIRTVANRMEYEHGLIVQAVQGLRTYAVQDALWQQGRDKYGIVLKWYNDPETGKRMAMDSKGIHLGVPWQSTVTDAKGGWSNHNFGLAVDLMVGIKGVTPWKPIERGDDPAYAIMGRIVLACQLNWGGTWQKPDMPHCYIGPKSPDAEMRSLYEAGGLAAVWRRYGGF